MTFMEQVRRVHAARVSQLTRRRLRVADARLSLRRRFPSQQAPMIAALVLTASLAVGAVPDDSLYVLDVTFIDQHGTKRGLDVHEGRPVLLAMFYATCPSACPRLIADVLRVLAKLSDDERREVRVVLVSLDPERDTPAVLTAVIHARGLDAERTTLMTAAAADTRALAALLGVKYRDDGRGAIDHSSRIVVLDRQGRIVGRRDGLGGGGDDVSGQLKRLVADRAR
jgi:protein SCO1/2